MPRMLARAAVCRLRAHLRCGGVMAYPTESSYGLGCLPTHPRGLRRLMALKKRPQHKGLIVIGADLAQLRPLLHSLPAAQQAVLQQHWPAPKTYVLAADRRIPIALRGCGRGKLAVRVPDHIGARQLCRQLNTALVSTSCNRAGEKPCRHARQVRQRFGRRVWVVQGRCGGRRQPSQMVDLASGERLR